MACLDRKNLFWTLERRAVYLEPCFDRPHGFSAMEFFLHKSVTLNEQGVISIAMNVTLTNVAV